MNILSSRSTLSLCLALSLSATIACTKSGAGETPSTNTPTANAPASTPGGTAPTTTTGTASKDISGNYSVTGSNVDGAGDYAGDLTVTKRDDVYQFSWTSGSKTYDGVGVQADNAVAVAFTEGTDGKGCGVVLYKIGADGSLDGKAGYWGVNQQEIEKGTRTSGSDLEGNYDISGSNPAGEKYTGKLAVKKDGEGYAFTWSGANPLTGFGVRTGDKVAVGIGGAKCAFVSYEAKPDGTLDGKWGAQGSKSFGTETAKKK